ncbi:MAG: alpha-ketoacid dehydrogenase subunit beta [Chloroflexi bacterium]|nr:alpha-ketoacid dehydrogenase subunit beta [Chloroflexota bacterium]|tara:strand:- start:13326 stop:14303 length:978 start_codon:yes stop_codon:yes gene_type:complete
MTEMILRDAIAKGLREALDTDKRTFLMGEDIGKYGGAYAVTRGFYDEYGEDRIKDTPISESVFVGAGTGAAMIGLRPIVEIMTINFSLVAMDQIVNHAAKLSYMSDGQISVPLIIRTVTGGGGQLGATHSQSFENWYASIPGLRVVVPSNPYDALGLFRTARKDNNPVIFAEHSLLYRVKGDVPEEYYEVPFGEARIAKPGEDVTLIAYSGMVRIAEEAAKILADKNISAEIIDLRTLSPLDIETVVESVKKTNRAVVIEETWKTGGFSGTIASNVQEAAFDYLDGPVIRVNGPDVSAPYAKNIESAMIPSADWVVETVTYNFGL